ncbi:serine aminopeptidase domain-containing protein [Sinobaca sp. H24]|uniref:serine aminopeptidase domain-containing protein n=1 Tax=Sinobaca sp. H24 TaxID=2923376 RepID=UPI00207AC44C|nr:alpha/beta hydrolase [Sinobaca sp. H24]
MEEERQMTTMDGTELFSKKNSAEQPIAAAVIVHGLAEHMDRYEALTETLVKHRITVYRYDQRGHARSGGRRVYFSDFNEMPNDAKTMVDTAKTENPDLPVFFNRPQHGRIYSSCFWNKIPGTRRWYYFIGGINEI